MQMRLRSGKERKNRERKEMLLNKEKFRLAVTDILTFAVSLVYLLGIRLWFPVCEASENGFMSCHWAGEVLKAMSIVLLLISIIHLVVPDEKVKIGMDIPLCCIYALSFCIPGRIIPLCKMAEMSCRRGTQIWTAVIMIVLLLIAIADIILYSSVFAKQKHSRNGKEEEK